MPASRKLGADDAEEIARSSTRVFVAKGKKLDVFEMKSAALEDVVAGMLGPTGNLRAPTLRVGKTTLVGFNEEAFGSVLL